VFGNFDYFEWIHTELCRTGGGLGEAVGGRPAELEAEGEVLAGEGGPAAALTKDGRPGGAAASALKRTRGPAARRTTTRGLAAEEAARRGRRRTRGSGSAGAEEDARL